MADKPAADEEVPTASYSSAELQNIIEAALRASREESRAAMQELQDRHAASLKVVSDQLVILQRSMAGTVPSATPEHAAGAGIEVAETWGQWDQEQAYAAAETARRNPAT